MEIYESPLLTPDRWKRYDAFENDGFDQPVYRRAYIPIQLEGGVGEHVIATVYADAGS
jgi:hypothetical protein